jgi:hypothetical protein
MLRAVALLPFLREIHRFSTTGHPVALDACYVASWQLPRPDLRRLADDSFRAHHALLGGILRFPLRSTHFWMEFLRN